MEMIRPFLKPELIWFVVALVLLILEFVMPGLIIFFFGLGALVVSIVCLITEISLNVQLIVFIGTSVLSLLVLRRWLKGIFFGRITGRRQGENDMEEFIGERAIVVKKITPKIGGKVELHGTNWRATADCEIAEGAPVEITGKDNLTFTVKPV